MIPLGALLLVGTANSAIGGGAPVAAAAAATNPMTRTQARIGPRRDWDDSWTIFDLH